MATNTERIQDAEVARLERMLRKREQRVIEAKAKLTAAKARAKVTAEQKAARRERRAA